MQAFHSLRRTTRSLGLVTVGVLSTLGALSLSHVGPAQAQSPGVNLAQLVAHVNALQSTVNSQAATISALQAKTAPLSVSSDPNVGGTSTLLTIKGVNVQIVSGSGSTNDNGNLLGLGNLIIGYNENDPGFTQARTGSHNLVVGTGHNYLSYGGLVAGQNNLISGPYATVTGGQNNVASSGHDSVSGGSGNVASGGSSSVSGGSANTASASYASVSGGYLNTVSNLYASISGGQENAAGGESSSISGGRFNTTGTNYNYASVSGGYDNTAGGYYASVSGGSELTENTIAGWKAGSESGVPFPTEGNFASD